MKKGSNIPLDYSGNKPSTVDSRDAIQNELSKGSRDSKNNELDITKVRERTFNKELDDLLTRIRSNESAERVRPEESGEPEKMSDDELLQMFHQLFYKSVNLAGLDKANTAFNPFDLYKELSGDEFLALIHNEMCSLSLPEYSILAYNPEKKSYASYTNHINSIDENNIIIDAKEELYAGIIKNKHGLILDHEAIERDLFLKKRFALNKAFYFISFGNFFIDFYSYAEAELTGDFSGYLFPILMIRLNQNIGEQKKKSIFNEIRAKLTVYFFLLQKKILLDIQNANSGNLHGIFSFLDYAYRKYNRDNDCICSIIKSKGYINIESLFILKYLHIKLKNKLADNAAISRIEKDRLIVFTRKSKKRIMDEILEDFNKLYNNLFQIEIFAGWENNDNISLLEKIKEHLVK